jgi:quinol monooxygenase YgiN
MLREVRWMSLLIVQRVPADTDQFEAFLAANSDLAEELSERARSMGCVAHRFAVGEREVVVADEWTSAEQFEAFMSSPDVQQALGQMGAQGEPEVTIADAKGFPGDF